MKLATLSVFFCFLLVLTELGIGRDGICSGERILVVAFISTKSHKLTYMPLVEQLGKQGHNITVLTPIRSTKELLNVHEVLTYDAESQNETFMEDPFKKKEQNKQDDPFSRVEYFVRICRETYDLPHVQQIMEEKFDLVITQPLINECALGLIYRIGAPLVFFVPISVPSFVADSAGVYFPLSFVPHAFISVSPEMNFYERMLNFGVNLMVGLRYYYLYMPHVQAVYKEKVGEDVPSIVEMWGNVSLILSNGHFSIHYHKPLLPDIVEVGGLSRKTKVAKPLSDELEEFISKGKENGFIYFSMGTVIKAKTMSEEKRKLFLNVFSKLKQQVLWKWDEETMPDLPKNVKLSKWLPQEDVLGHKNIKMFITHCGGGGTEEAIFHGTPMIGLPMFGDQNLNSKLAQSHGVLIETDWNDLTEELLSSSIQEMLTNPTYTDKVKRLSSIYQDQPQDPMTRAVYWVEYIIRHKGAPHLRSAGRKLNYFQYHSYDVVAAYLSIIVGLLYFVYAIVKWVVRKICCRSSKRSSSVTRKSKRE